MTRIQKIEAPRSFWINQINQFKYDAYACEVPGFDFHTIEHAAYLAVKQELDAARAKIAEAAIAAGKWGAKAGEAQLETEKLKKNFSEVNEIFERRQTTLRDALERILQFRGHADIHSIAKKALEDSV